MHTAENPGSDESGAVPFGTVELTKVSMAAWIPVSRGVSTSVVLVSFAFVRGPSSSLGIRLGEPCRFADASNHNVAINKRPSPRPDVFKNMATILKKEQWKENKRGKKSHGGDENSCMNKHNEMYIYPGMNQSNNKTMKRIRRIGE